jgi:hypothetical protein
VPAYRPSEDVLEHVAVEVQRAQLVLE